MSRDLELRLTLDAPRAAIWRCWTEPDLLTQWFTPPPWITPHAELDVRTGGTCFILMRGPNGEEIPNRGVYLDVVPGERLVMTDAYVSAWVPSEKPFMTSIITLADAGQGRTGYSAVARHWSEDDRKAHEDMGFFDGWTTAARQLEAVAAILGDGK